MIIFLIIFNLFYVPFSFAFDKEMIADEHPELYLLKFFSENVWTFIFILDIIIILNSGYYRNE